MEYKLLTTSETKTFVVVFAEGDEFTEEMLRFAREEQLTAASFTALGAFSDVTLGWFDLDQRDYLENSVDEQVEVVSLVGNIAEFEGQPKLHAHVVVAKRDATALGGHLLSAHVRPTLEVTVTETPVHLHRLHDPSTGLALIRPGGEGLPPRGGRKPDAGVR